MYDKLNRRSRKRLNLPTPHEAHCETALQLIRRFKSENPNTLQSNCRRLLFAIILSLAIIWKLDLVEDNLGYHGLLGIADNLIRSFPAPSHNIEYLLTVIAIWLLLYLTSTYAKYTVGKKTAIFLGILFGFAMTFGWALEQYGEVSVLFTNPVQILKTLSYIFGWTAISYCALLILFETADRVLSCKIFYGSTPSSGIHRGGVHI